MRPMSELGAMHPVSLRFLDDGLEERFQREAGAEGLVRFRLNAVTSCVLWLAAGLLPLVTDLRAELIVPFTLAMAAVSLVVALLSRWATTLDRQHALAAAVLTVGNGLVVLVIVTEAGILPGYGVAAITLLFVWGFVLRARFVFAAARTVAIVVLFGFAAALHTGPSLVLDGFILVGASIGSLVAHRILERTRRRLFHRDIVITEQSAAIEVERQKSDRLLLNVMPASISARLRENADHHRRRYPAVSILFADIVGFTGLAARLSPAAVVELLGSLYTAFDGLAEARGLEKIKTVGDTYMAAGGLPLAIPDHARAHRRSRVGDDRRSRAARGWTAGGQAPRRCPLRPGRGRRHREPQVRVRRVGRHRQCRELAWRAKASRVGSRSATPRGRWCASTSTRCARHD